jgi:hypothetical protein
VSFVVITPDGRLLDRTVDNTISHDGEWGPYQDTLWTAVRGEVDPHRGQVGGVGLDGGMRAKLAEDAAKHPEHYPPNPLASAMLTSLGQPPRLWQGVIAIMGTENDEGITHSLTAQQRAIIDRAHRLATAGER